MRLIEPPVLAGTVLSPGAANMARPGLAAAAYIAWKFDRGGNQSMIPNCGYRLSRRIISTCRR
jgi:hypothetical protein